MAYERSDNLLFSATADKVITNTVTETSALATGTGTRMIPANTLTPGKRIRIHGEGIYTIPAVLASSVIIKVKLNNTVIGQVTTSSMLAGATARSFTFDCLVAFRTIGTTGSCVIGGTASYTTNGGTKVFDDIDNGGAIATIDTTIDQTVDVTITWSAASTTRSMTTTIATIMVV